MAEELSFAKLFGPNRDYRYLEGASNVTLGKGDAFDPTCAWWLAELSMLTYVKEHAFIRTQLEQVQAAEIRIIDAEEAGVRVIIAEVNSCLIIVFRGTETDSLINLQTDLDALPVKWEQGGLAHRGFQAALQKVWERIHDSILEFSGEDVYYGGHSMGGALALLAASRSQKGRAVYTFGTPRVGDSQFAESFPLSVYRIVHNNDIVTEIPLPGLYRHVGIEYHLSHTGELQEKPELRERLARKAQGHLDHARQVAKAWMNGDATAIPQDNVVDHAPIFYATLLKLNRDIKQASDVV